MSRNFSSKSRWTMSYEKFEKLVGNQLFPIKNLDTCATSFPTRRFCFSFRLDLWPHRIFQPFLRCRWHLLCFRRTLGAGSCIFESLPQLQEAKEGRWESRNQLDFPRSVVASWREEGSRGTDLRPDHVTFIILFQRAFRSWNESLRQMFCLVTFFCIFLHKNLQNHIIYFVNVSKMMEAAIMSRERKSSLMFNLRLGSDSTIDICEI